MIMRTPITIITGPLGSGKTTLLRNLLDTTSRKLAVVMNEFGEIAIDSKIIEGKSIRLAELGGGCVCCSLIGEFEAAVNELIDTVEPEQIVLETTGVAEPGALIFDIDENLPRVRLDATISVIDADGLLKFPSLGHTTRLQIEAADLIILNKIDLVSGTDLQALEEKLRRINEAAPILPTQRCKLDPELLFFGARTPSSALGATKEKNLEPAKHLHEIEFDSFSYSSAVGFNRDKFEQFAESLAPEVYRAKGFVRFADGTHLFNYVGGRWEFEPFAGQKTELVFIGKQLKTKQNAVLDRLKACEE